MSEKVKAQVGDIVSASGRIWMVWKVGNTWVHNHPKIDLVRFYPRYDGVTERENMRLLTNEDKFRILNRRHHER